MRRLMALALAATGIVNTACAASRALGLPEWGENVRLCQVSQLIAPGMTIGDAGQLADGLLDVLGWEEAKVVVPGATTDIYQFRSEGSSGVGDGVYRPSGLMTIRATDGLITSVNVDNMCN